ncbi:MAG: XRE family transcriptional regulator [Alistipes sp.]|nr:XRE family transcriptional regulator [Alistipes sp.]
MKTKVDIEIIKRVKAKRLEQGDSLRGIARILKTHHSFPQQVEKVDTPCKYSADQLYYLAQEFNCPISDLYPPLDQFEPKG